MKIAILLATRNGDKWIADQLNSLINQDVVGIIDIYVSDDCSSDSTLSILNSFSISHKITLASFGKRYGSASANFISMFQNIDLSKYDYVFLSDQDDLWLENKMSSAIEAMCVNKTDCYASALTCIYNNNNKPALLFKSNRQTNFDYFFQGASAGCTYALNKIAISTIVATLKPHPISCFVDLSHDWLIYCITRSRGLIWYIDPNPYILYRQHASNSWGALGFSSIIKRLKFIKSRWYFNAIRRNLIYMDTSTADQRLVRYLSLPTLFGRLFVLLNCLSFRRVWSESLLVAFLLIFNLA